MTTSNHLLVGAMIAVTVKQPILVLPLAFASHFVLDGLPHYGFDGSGYGEAMKHKLTYVVEILGLIGLILLFSTGLYGFNLVMLSALVAVSPDFEWPYRYFLYERKGKVPPDSFLTKFHQKIQWCERPWGIVMEIIFFAIMFTLLLRIT